MERFLLQAPKPAMTAPSTVYTGFQETYIQSLLKTLDVQTPEQSKNEIKEVPINKTKSRRHRPNRKVPILRKSRKKVTHPVTTGYEPNIVRRYNIENFDLKLTEEFKEIFYKILKELTVDTNIIASLDLSKAINENQSLRAVHKSQYTWDDDIYELLEQTCDYECIEKRGVCYIVLHGFNTPDCGAEIKAPHLKDDAECELQMKIELEEETFTPGTNTNVETIDSGHLLSADRVKVEIEEDTGTNTNFTSTDSYLPFACDRMVKIEEGVLPALDNESSLPAKRTKEKPNSLSLPANGDIAATRLRPMYCFVPECRSNSKDFPDKLYFTVPFIGNLREKWLKVVGRDTNSAHLSLKCCSDHFDLEKDTEIWVRNKNRGEDVKIKKGVLPHKFECQQKTAPSCDEVDKSTDVMEAYYRRRYNKSCLMYCFVPFCKSNTRACPDKIYFAVPENKKLRADWMKAVGRNELSMKSKTLACCSDHFDLSKDVQEQVKKNLKKYPKLKKGVIPHQFQCQHRIRKGIKTMKPKKTKPTVQRDRKEIMDPDDKNIEYSGSTDSERGMDSHFPSDDEILDNTRPDGVPILCQCSSCSDFISDVRYRCLQCSWWLCVACEARSIHKQHCVVRAPSYNVSLDPVEIRSMVRNLKRILQNKNHHDIDDWRMDAVEDDVKPDMRVNDVPTVTTTEFYNGFQEEHIPYDNEEIITSDKETVFYDPSMTPQPQHPIGTQPTIQIPLTNALTKETEQCVLKRQPQHPINTQPTIKIPLINAFTKETKQCVLKRQPQHPINTQPTIQIPLTNAFTKETEQCVLKRQPQHPINTQPTIQIPLTNAFTKETEQCVLKRPQVHIPIAGQSSADDIKKGLAQSIGQNNAFKSPQVFMSNLRGLTSKTSTVTQNETFLIVTSGPAKSSTKTSKGSSDIQDTLQPFASFLEKNKEFRVVPALSPKETNVFTAQSNHSQLPLSRIKLVNTLPNMNNS